MGVMRSSRLTPAPRKMNGTLNRLDQLEARFERLRLDLQDTQRKLTQALQQIRDGQAKYVPTGGGNANAIFWAHAPEAIAAATGSWPTLIAVNVHVGHLRRSRRHAHSWPVRRRCAGFTRTALPSGSLIPVEPTDNGTAWDAIGNSCTAV